MTQEKFDNLILTSLDFPFSIEDVIDVEENCGTIWIETLNGTYYLSLEKCEDDENIN